MKRIILATFLLLAGQLQAAGLSPALGTLMEQWQAEAEMPFSPARGAQLWQRDHNGRACTTCHTGSPRNPGRHHKTGKPIEPMAPSVNPDRFTDAKKISKWLLRNCKWTLGRTCTAQEKGDLMSWLSQQ